jgi:hypothetical protein
MIHISVINTDMYYIYALIDPRNNQPFYIGKGSRKNQRHLDHFNESIESTSNRHKLFKIQFIKNLGLDIPVEFLEDNIIDENIAYDKESYYIKFYGRANIDVNGILTNICLDNKPPNQKGKKQSPEHLSKRIQSYKNTCKTIGRKSVSDETKRKIARPGSSNPFYGRFHTKECKETHSLRMKGNKNNSKTYKFTDPTGKIYIVRGEFYKFCIEHGLAISTMEKVLKNNKVPVGGKCKGWNVVKL